MEKKKFTNPYSTDQWFVIAAAIVFLIGAIFMLINTFGGIEWAFFVGIAAIVIASGLMIASHFLFKNNQKKVESSSEITEQE